jgi:hypothetical protein
MKAVIMTWLATQSYEEMLSASFLAGGIFVSADLAQPAQGKGALREKPSQVSSTVSLLSVFFAFLPNFLHQRKQPRRGRQAQSRFGFSAT